MDINRWNDLANKSQNVCDRYNSRITAQSKRLNGDTFICPWCNKEHPISSAKIIKIVAGEELIDKQHGFNSTTKTYTKVTCNVRFCKRCFDKNQKHKHIFYLIAKIVYAIVGIALFYWLITTDEELGFYGWVGAILGFLLLGACMLGAQDFIDENFFDTANVEEAYRNNAIVHQTRPRFW